MMVKPKFQGGGRRFTFGNQSKQTGVTRGNVGKVGPSSTPGFRSTRGQLVPLDKAPPVTAKPLTLAASTEKFQKRRNKRASRLAGQRSATLLGN